MSIWRCVCVCAPLCFSDVFIQVSIFKNMQVELEDGIAGPANQMKIYLKMHNVIRQTFAL